MRPEACAGIQSGAPAPYSLVADHFSGDDMDNSKLFKSAEAVRSLGVGKAFRDNIAGLERALVGRSRDEANALVTNGGIDTELLLAALTIKAMAGQINVVVHALGILVSLPHLLSEGERIQSLSLGAGNTGRSHDLETDRRVAEFKFIGWRGGPEAIRQNSLFVDLFNLANYDTDKQRELYVVDKSVPLRFLTGNRAIRSVLSKHSSVQTRFDQLHGSEQYATVRQYWGMVQDRVELIDLRDKVPAFSAAATALLAEDDSIA
jgi:hypothetical protein